MKTLTTLFFCFLLQVFFIIRNNAQNLKPTENLCHYDILPPDVLSLLQLSAAKILRGWNPSKDTKMVTEIKEKLLILNNTMFIKNNDTSEENSVWNLIMNHQSNYEKMLSSVLNAVIELLSNVDSLEESGTKTSEIAFNNMKQQVKTAEALNNMTKLLEDMFHLIETKETQTNTEETEYIRKSREIEQKSLDLQLETHFLVKSLVDGKREEVSMRERIHLLEKEVHDLTREKEKLSKKIKNDYSRPADCHDLYISGVKQSGLYDIYPYRCYCSKPIQVWCDMKEDGGGWTVLLSRKKTPKQVNFTRSWEDYKKGFGDPFGEYYIGNEHLHALSTNRHYTLRINMQNRSGKKRWGQWNEFSVGSAQDNYELHVGEFSPFSTITKDVLRKHNKQHFSTFDKDNDASYQKNCAAKFKGGWWYGRCFDIHPTGIFLASDRKTSVATSYFYIGKKSLIPLKRLTMMVKPRSCVPHTLENEQIFVNTCKLP